MKENKALDFDTMEKLEELSVKMEQLTRFAHTFEIFVYEKINENYEGEEIDQLEGMASALVDVVHNREADLDSIILQAPVCKGGH